MKKLAIVVVAFLVVGLLAPLAPATAAGGYFDHLGKKFDFKPVAFYKSTSSDGFVLDNLFRLSAKNTTGQAAPFYGVIEPLDLSQDGVWKSVRLCWPDISIPANVADRTGSFIPANGVQELAVEFLPNDELTGQRFYELGTASLKVWPDGDSAGYSDLRLATVLVPMSISTLTLGGKEIIKKSVLSWDRTIADPIKRFRWTSETIGTVPPLVIKGSSFLPMRAVGENIFGCTVEWDQNTKTASYIYGNGVATYKVSFTIGQTVAMRTLICGDGETFTDTVKMDVAAVLNAGSTMVPLRAIATLMKATVDYESRTKKITITYPEKKTNFTDLNTTHSTTKTSLGTIMTNALQTLGGYNQVQSTTAITAIQSFIKDVKFFTSVRTGGKSAQVTLFYGYPYMGDVHYADAYIIMSPSRSKVYAWDRIHVKLGRITFGGPENIEVCDPESRWFQKFMVGDPSDPNPYSELFKSVSWPWNHMAFDGSGFNLYMLDANRYYIAIEIVDPETGEKRTISPFTQQQIFNAQTGIYAEDKLGKYIVDMFDLNKWANDRYKIDTRKEFLADGKEFDVGQTISIDNINMRNVKETDRVEVCLAYQKNTKEILPNNPNIGHRICEMTYGELKESGLDFVLTQQHLDYFENRLIEEYKKGYIVSGKKVEDYGPYGPYGYFFVIRKLGDQSYIRSEGYLTLNGALTYSVYP